MPVISEFGGWKQEDHGSRSYSAIYEVQGQPGLFKIRESPLTFKSMGKLFSSLSPPLLLLQSRNQPTWTECCFHFSQSHVIVWTFLQLMLLNWYCAYIFLAKYWKLGSHRPCLKAACWVLLQRSDPVVRGLGTFFCFLETEASALVCESTESSSLLCEECPHYFIWQRRKLRLKTC